MHQDESLIHYYGSRILAVLTAWGLPYSGMIGAARRD